MRRLYRVRAKVEGLAISEPALDRIAEHGSRVSLRYALQLLTPANILANVNGRNEIGPQDVEECEDLFIDARRSAKIVENANGAFVS